MKPADATARGPSEPRLAFFDKRFYLHADRLVDECGCTPTQAVADLIRRYPAVRKATVHRPPAEEWCSFRELRGAGPLIVQFANNTHKTIAAAFGGDLSALDSAAAAVGGVPEQDPGFDRCYRFQALPEVPLRLNCNAADDLFPAQAHFLFPRSVRDLLDIRDFFTLGTYLTGRLITGRAGGDLGRS
jgi:hypothetical protein